MTTELLRSIMERAFEAEGLSVYSFAPHDMDAALQRMATRVLCAIEADERATFQEIYGRSTSSARKGVTGL